MKYEREENQLIRRYILRQLASDEREIVEKRLMNDDNFFNQVLLGEEDIIEEYIESTLADSERKLFEKNFLSDPASRQRVNFTRSLREKSGVLSANRFARPSLFKKVFSSSYLKIAAVLVILIVVGDIVRREYFGPSGVEDGTIALQNAYRNHRPLEARISQFNYAPFSASRGDDTGNIDQLQRDLARRLLVEAALKDSGFRSHHALGRLYLAELEFDKAVGQFEAALRIDDKNAYVHSDMGVALFERAKKRRLDGNSEGQIEEFARSLEHFSKAIELDDSILEARFNRALCYLELLLQNRAAEEWKSYIERDPNSGWTEEARVNLRMVEEKTENPNLARKRLFQNFLNAYSAKDEEKAWEIFSLNYGSRYNFVLEKLIDDYLELTAKGDDEEARNRLQAISYAGDVSARKVGDSYASEVARVYAMATPDRRKLLAEGRAEVVKGYTHSSSSRVEAAAQSFQKAAAIFEKVGNTAEAVSAELRAAQAYVRLLNTKLALAILQRIVQTSENNQYKWLTGRIYYSIADARLNYQEYSESLSYSIRAAKESEQAGDRAGEVRHLFMVANTYNLIGDSSKSLSFVQRGLTLAENLPIEPRQQMYIYGVTTDSFSALEMFAVALDYQKEALRISEEEKEPITTSRYYQDLGKIYRKLNNYSEAIRYAKLAFDVGLPLSDASARQDIMAYSSLTLGHLYRESGQFDQAISSYDQNIQIYDRLDSQWLRYEAHAGKFLCYRAKGEVAQAQKELETALRLYQENRLKITEESNRNAFFEGAQVLYDAAIDFEYSSKNNPQGAFDIAESGRARSLLDLTSADTELLQSEYGTDINLQAVSKPLNLSDIQHRLPDQTQIVQYSVFEDKVLIWVVSANDVRSAVKEINRKDLRGKILGYLERLRRFTPGEDDQLKRDATDLYDYLIKPVESFLNREGLICIVPDKLLNYLPYGALFSAESGRYMIEDYTLVFAPSSTMFLNCSRKAQEKQQPEVEKLLAVGNPSFDRSLFQLSDLPSAKREVEQISSYYDAPSPFTGVSARERSVREAMSQADVIHLATHYVTDERSPMASKLLLASEENGTFASKESDGVLQAWEIYAMSLKRTRLVVLAACQTGVERTYQGEGAISIARPFIKAGVPLIVASLWPVESRPTSDLMIIFHRYRKQGNLSTAEALRRAQRDMIESSSAMDRHPSHWASFILIGGKASF
jgi:CHAT domain-containing protein/lipoprotein NlpI